MGASVLVALLLGGCSGPSEPSAQAGGTLRLTLASWDFPSIDPQRTGGSRMAAAVLGGFVFRTLTAYPPSEGAAATTVVPDLATDVGISTDGGLTWTFGLRTEVTYDNAVAFACADVVYGVARNYARELGNDGTGAVAVLDVPADETGASFYRGPYVDPAGDPRAEAGSRAFESAVRCADDGRSITFRLREPTGDFPELVAGLEFAPVPTGGDIGLSYEQRPAGTGPYRVEDAIAGSSFSLVRGTYWKAETDPLRPAYPDRIEVTLSDRPDLLGPVAGTATGDLAGEVRSMTGADGTVALLVLNTRALPDPQLRRAIQVALDREAIAVALGTEPADSVVPPGVAWARPTNAWSGLLDDPGSGTGLGQGTPAQVAVCRPDTGAHAAAADRIRQSLQTIGIDAVDTPVPPSAYLDTLASAAAGAGPRCELFLLDWTQTPRSGAGLYAELFSSGGRRNVAGYASERADELIRSVATEVAAPVRAEFVRELQQLLIEDGVLVPLGYYQAGFGIGPDVQGGTMSPIFGAPIFGRIWLSTE